MEPVLNTTPAAVPIECHTLPNGLTILVQPMPWLRTAALSLNLHAGVHVEPEHLGGLSGLVCEMIQRGAGKYSSRDLVAVQDNLGIDRNSGVSTALVSFGAAMPSESLQAAIEIHAEIVRNPHLPQNQLDDAKMMAVQELRAMEDEPTHRVMRRLRELHYGKDLGRSIYGTETGINEITQDNIRDFYQTNYHAGGSILSIAGKVETQQILDWAQAAFGDWKTGEVHALASPNGIAKYEHFESASSQTHIGFAFNSIPYGHPDYFKMRAGIGVLSDGMSSRLFDRVREQRGLCYTVTASCHSLKNGGGVFGYAGTTPERAQETLDVTLHEIEHLIEDIELSELERWKVRIESGLIMEQESSASRTSSLASDFYQIGRPITTDELETTIESLTLDDVRHYWSANPPSDYRIVTLGPNALTIPNSSESTAV
ncbi:MAG: pitrilysin family protein [Rubripirellula sp.]|nr:pitrilysin family protein [Rubripirellula sp.]